jgi:peptidoglycan/LPS O-acetylase OafA/YrhL
MLQIFSMGDTSINLLNGKIKTLDGFRGLAILLVIGYHYLSFFSFGWIGVDLFFVLSGFLITGKLVESFGSKHYFSSFYVRRILRILPVYYFVLLLFLAVIPLFFPSLVSTSFKEVIQQQKYYWTFTVNLQDAAYGWPLNITLIHFWSLACEMQFYLLWPFVIYFFYKKGILTGILMFFIATGLICRLYGQSLFPLNDVYRYVLFPCRIDAFSAGALLFIFFQKDKIAPNKGKFLFAVFALFGATLLIMFIENVQWHFSVSVVKKYGYTMNAIFWSALIGFTLSPGQYLCKTIFTSNLMIGFGKYSYGMYIFHLPIFVILSGKHIVNAALGNRWLLALVAFVSTCLCSFASYHLVEKNFLKYKQRWYYAKD